MKIYILILSLLLQLFAPSLLPAAAQEVSADANAVVINPVDYGADPTGEADSADAIWEAFQAAKEATENGASSVTVSFPEGEYHIYKDHAQKREYHTSNTNSIQNPIKTISLLIENQENFTLDGNGSLFLMHGNMMALAVVDSKNITLRDFSWDFGVPTVTELTVTDMGTTESGQAYTDFFVPACFPHTISGTTFTWQSERSPYDGEFYWTQTNSHSPTYAVVAYQPDGEMSRNYAVSDSPFNGASEILELDETHVRVVYSASRPSMQKIGTIIELSANAHRQTAGAFTWESENVTARNVNVHFMHGFGWLIQMSKDVYYYDCNLLPREGSGHITTSFADGIHASGATGELVIENCNFANTHDDPINLHGTFTRVEKRKDAHTLILKYIHAQQGGFPQFHVGDKTAFFTRDTLESSDGETLYTVAEVISNPAESGDDLRTMEIRFEEELPEHLSDKIGNEPKYVAENVTYAPTVTIRNCTFERVPTRGILCTTRNPVLIEGNTFKNMSMASIYLSNDSNNWYESGPIRDMTIKNNEFFIKSIGRTAWEYAPAIYVNPVTKGGGLPSVENPIHKNITIEGNIFHMDTDVVVKAESVENLTIKNNTILRMNPNITLSVSAPQTTLLVGDNLRLNATADGSSNTKETENVYEFQKCKNVKLEGNTYDDGLKRYAVLSDMPDEYLDNQDADIQIAHDRNQPAAAPVQNIGYVSSNPDVLSVDKNGKLSAKKAGKASVYAYYIWNGEPIPSESIEITVADESSVAPEDVVTIQEPETTMLTEADATLIFQAKTDSEKEITWSVEDFLTGGESAAAVIDENGVLTAKENGIVWVKAQAGLSTSRTAVIISLSDSKELNPSFEIKRENASAYALTKETATITMNNGDLFKEKNNVQNLFLYEIPEAIDKDNLRAVLKVENLPTRETKQWDTASFLLYQDDDNYISVGKKSHYDGIVTVREANASGTETGGEAAQNNLTTAYLGFHKQGNLVSVAFKEEGGEWQTVKSDIDASMLTNYRLGFTAWVTNERDKTAIFSGLRAASGDVSYEALCEQQAVSFFAESKNNAPTVSNAAFDKTAYEVGETASVTYEFRDKDGDGEGKSLYCFSYDNGLKEISEQPTILLAYAGTVNCEIYPVDANDMPGEKAATEQVVVTQPVVTPPPIITPPKGEDDEDLPPKKDDEDTKVKPLPSVGETIEQDGILYQITNSDATNGTAAAIGCSNAAQSKIVIPAAVQKNDYTFFVTEIKEKAFQKMKRLKSLEIGENVAKIGKSAFFRCRKLKKIQLKGTKAPKMEKKVWKGISAKCKVTLPKKMAKKQFQKLQKALKSAGIGNKVSYKKK